MLHIPGYDGHAPVRHLRDTLQKLAPNLFTAGDPNRAELLLTPRVDDSCDATGWYDLYWSHPSVERVDVPFDGGRLETTRVAISRIAPIPPPLIPAETRIAAADPVTLDGMGGSLIDIHGGPDVVRRVLTTRRNAAIRDDRSPDAYDWNMAAMQVITAAGHLDPPKLTPGQRAHAAAARFLAAHFALTAARKSLNAHLHNAVEAAESLDDLAALRAAVSTLNSF